jgi:hypothetical protein
VIHLRDVGPPLKGVGAPYDDHTTVHGRFELGIDRRNDPDGLGELFVTAGPDPKILVADEMLHQIVHKPLRVHPGVTLAWQPFEPCPPDACCQVKGYMAMRGNNCFYGALLTFDTTSGRIIYRIGEFHLGLNAWWAQWPD